MTKKAARQLTKLQSVYSNWDLHEFNLRLALLESGPCWVAEVGKHKGINRKCPLKAIKDLRKQLDRAAVSGFKTGVPVLYPAER